MSDERKYSDGDIENKIARYLSEHDGNTTNIIQDLPEGTVFHNFTSARSNLISWYPFLSNDRVLEIGAGMGALTVQLAQMCRQVVALEPSIKEHRLFLCAVSNILMWKLYRKALINTAVRKNLITCCLLVY